MSLPIAPDALTGSSAEWYAYGRALAEHVLALPAQAELVRPNLPPLRVAQRQWEVGVPVGKIHEVAAQTATLSGDGRPVWSHWCDCVGPGADPVYFERYGRAGMLSHGWACPECRGLVQTG